MQSFFPKALLYKEWLQQRWLFVMGMLWMSLSPGMQLISFQPAHSKYFLDVTLPGLEYLIPVYGIVLAVLSLRELFQGVEEPFVNEPIRRIALVRTKFLVGAVGILTTQAIVSGWYGLALQGYPVSYPFIMTFTTWWLLAMGTLACYAIAFVTCLAIRPMGLGVFFAILCLVIPYITDSWFQGLWSTKEAGGGIQTSFPRWASHVYTGLHNLSPLAVSTMLPHDLMIGRSEYFYRHNLIPFIWIIAGYPLVEYLGRRNPLRPFDDGLDDHGGKMLRAGCSLVFALSADYFFGAGQMANGWGRIIAFLVIWLATHLLLKALLTLGSGDMGTSRRKRKRHRRGGVSR